MIKGFKKAMMVKFEMTDLELMKYFLGMQVKQSPAKRILRYIKGTKNYGHLYKTQKDARLVGYIDNGQG